MKLLLTSSGLSNNSIATALQELVGKDPKDTRIAFIPTAANPERGDKGWLVDDLHRIKEHGYYIDIIELSAIGPEHVRGVFEEFDVLFVGGGNTFYLSYWMEKSGLMAIMPELLETKVYVGISAGSMIAGQSLVLASEAQSNLRAFEDKDYDDIGPTGESSGAVLGLVGIIFRPHLNSPFFPLARIDALKEQVKGLAYPVYALDDNSALRVVDGEIDVVSEGEWVVSNEE